MRQVLQGLYLIFYHHEFCGDMCATSGKDLLAYVPVHMVMLLANYFMRL